MRTRAGTVAVIRTEGLSKSFNGRPAVEDLTIDVAAGEVFGFLGPNGAGKTTTVRLLATLIAPTAGRAWVAGFEVGRDDTAIRRRVGLLTETPGHYERLTARQNLDLYASLYEVPPAEVPARVEEYLRLVGLWEDRDRLVAVFSKGMKQRLAVARALVHRPEVLFLDEPTSGLDPEAAREVRELIAALPAEGRTIFLTTHNLDEAERLCHRVGIINRRLIVVDAPAALGRGVYGRQVEVRLAGSPAAAVGAVRALPFVRSVEVLDGALRLRVDHPEQNNPELVRVLVRAGADVLSLGEVRHSLEEVYLALVQGSRQTPSPGAPTNAPPASGRPQEVGPT